MDPHERESKVLDALFLMIRELAAGPAQQQLLLAVIEDLQRKRHAGHGPAATVRAMHLPLLVYAAITGDEEPAVPLGAICTLLYAGVDLFDDVIDGDLTEEWRAFQSGEPLLASVTLIAALAPLALAGLDAPAERIVAMMQTLARSGLVMSAGQQLELRLTGATDALSLPMEVAVLGKSGGFGALMAGLAAQFAGAPPEDVACFAEYGRALAVAGQIRSDLGDLFTGAHSRDLTSGTRTVPIALALEGLTGEARLRFELLLQRARTEVEVHTEIQAHARSLGVIDACARLVEYYGASASASLGRVEASPSAAASLNELVRRVQIGAVKHS